jgi:hypothetical protein
MPTKATESAGGKVGSSVIKNTSTGAGAEAENAKVNATSFPSPPLLAEYALGWSLHQLAPFLDKMVGVAGAMDHRMIEKPYDWYVRLPLALMCLMKPNSHTLLVAHIVNIVCWFDVMPAVWDYMVWCAILESTFVIAALISISSEEVSKRFLPAIRAQLIVLYFSAGALACMLIALPLACRLIALPVCMHADRTLLLCSLLEADDLVVRHALLVRHRAHVRAARRPRAPPPAPRPRRRTHAPHGARASGRHRVRGTFTR